MLNQLYSLYVSLTLDDSAVYNMDSKQVNMINMGFISYLLKEGCGSDYDRDFLSTDVYFYNSHLDACAIHNCDQIQEVFGKTRTSDASCIHMHCSYCKICILPVTFC